jgi:hypothetical protein
MLPGSSATFSTSEHLTLYQNSRGDRMRLIARLGLLIAGGVLSGVTWRGINAAMTQSSESVWTFATVSTGLFIMVLTVVFGRGAWTLGRNYVVHFEVWPKSHFAVVRTAGWWKEITILVPWSDIRTGDITDSESHATHDSLMRMRLRSGAKLIFDHNSGHAPQNWAALSRFLEKCSLPGSPDEQYPFGQKSGNLPPMASTRLGS